MWRIDGTQRVAQKVDSSLVIAILSFPTHGLFEFSVDVRNSKFRSILECFRGEGRIVKVRQGISTPACVRYRREGTLQQ